MSKRSVLQILTWFLALTTAMATVPEKIVVQHLKNNAVQTQTFTNLVEIDSGTYGTLFSGITETGVQVAFKKGKQLANEWEIYLELGAVVDIGADKKNEAREAGIPHVYMLATVVEPEEWEGSSLLFMELLSKSLHTFAKEEIVTPDKSVSLLISMMKATAYVHFKNVMHGDVKPKNFVFGSGSDSDKLFLLDFGMAKKVCDINANDLACGTPCFSSLNVNQIRKREFSKEAINAIQRLEDDIESVVDTFIFVEFGTLPWEDELFKFLDNRGDGYADEVVASPKWSAEKATHFNIVLDMMEMFPNQLLAAFTIVNCECLGKVLQDMVLIARVRVEGNPVNIDKKSLIGIKHAENLILLSLCTEYQRLADTKLSPDSWKKQIGHYFTPIPVQHV